MRFYGGSGVPVKLVRVADGMRDVPQSERVKVVWSLLDERQGSVIGCFETFQT